MGILDTIPILQIETRQDLLRKELIESSQQSLNQLKIDYVKRFNRIWNNGELTPQQVFDAYGTDAVEFFTLAYGNYLYIQSIDPNFQMPAPYLFTLNQDGTITVGEAVS